MKKRTAGLTACIVLAVAGAAAAAGASGEYKGHPIVHVVVNGKAVSGEVPGINMDGTTLVPLRAIGESLGAEVGWDPATSTAAVKLAVSSGAAADPKADADRNAAEALQAFYSMTESYFDHLEEVREKIRIAKEFYDIRKNDFYLNQMSGEFWKAFEEEFSAILAYSSKTFPNGVKGNDDPYLPILQAAERAHKAMNSYKMSIDQLKLSISMGKSEFIDFYIQNYSGAFEDELKAKKQLRTASEAIRRLEK